MTPPPDRYTELNAALVEAAEQVTICRRLRSRLDSKRARLVALQGQLPALEQQVAKELKDVEQLEGLSLAALWSALFGDREARRDKERQEYFDARRRLESSKAETAKLQAEITEVERQLDELGDAEERYESLLAGKEALVRSSDDEVAAEWSALSDQLREVRTELRELREAHHAGKLAQFEIEALRGTLAGATGAWPSLSRREAVSHAMIHEAEIQRTLHEFGRELADVGIEPPEATAIILDYESAAESCGPGMPQSLFDIDLVHYSLRAVEVLQRDVDATLEQLDELIATSQKRADELEQQIEQLLISAE
jgi:chromosome segregation ATPase